MQGDILASKPIQEIVMSQIDRQYVIPIRRYLESLGCAVTLLDNGSGYRVQFPAGTQEETRAGLSTQFTHRTTVRFPNGKTLTKYVVVVMPQATSSATMLAFPNEVLRK